MTSYNKLIAAPLLLEPPPDPSTTSTAPPAPVADEVAPRPYYGQPSPPRSFLFAGAGWAYGLGCGAGPFLGIGVAVNNSVLFGAGAGVGVFCGVGFGSGAVVGHGHGFVPLGFNSSFFYAPRLGWAENFLERYHKRQQRLGGRRQAVPWQTRVKTFWDNILWPRIGPVFAPRAAER